MGVMNEKILYTYDSKRFRNVQKIAQVFLKNYIGNNIVQDDIFSVVENYVLSKDMPFELLRFPIDDEELCACTFIRGGRIFVMLNSSVYLAKQIFAMAHELFHIRCYLEDNNLELIQTGSILKASTINAETSEEEELEANAFAGTLLVPSQFLKQQIEIYNVNKDDITVNEILVLMDIFAVPYKAMVFRLLEQNIISLDKVIELLSVPKDEINKKILFTGKAKRWSIAPTGCEKLGTLNEILTENEHNEALPASRLQSDRARLQEIMKKYNIK